VHRGVSVTRVSRQTDGTILLEGMRESAVVGEGAVVGDGAVVGEGVVVGDEPLPMEPFSLRVDTLVSQVITSDYASEYASDYVTHDTCDCNRVRLIATEFA
jgi:NDP-sugar pyrophosphorylase family protein